MTSPLRVIHGIEDMYSAAELGQQGPLEEETDQDRKIRDLQEQLSTEKSKLDATSKDLNAANEKLAQVDDATREIGDFLGRANRAIEARAGGDWKELVLLLGSSALGLGLGYYVQRILDKRIPWVALVGVGVAVAGFAVRSRWSIRGSLLVGGTTLAGGSAFYVFTSMQPRPGDLLV